MSILKIVECKGYTKEEAFANLRFDPNSPIIPGTNATQAWNRAGKPIPGSLDFKRFVTQQLEEKTKSKPGFGIHIVLDPPIKDVRRRPYTVINNKATGTREWKFVYEIREDILDVNWLANPSIDEDGNMTQVGEDVMEISVVEPGLVVEVCESKSEALEKMKELITQTHKCYSILPIKVPDIAPIAAFGIYTPSSGSKEGTFIACGINKEDND